MNHVFHSHMGSQNVTFSSFWAESVGIFNGASLATTHKLPWCLAASLLMHSFYVRAADGSQAGSPAPPGTAFMGTTIMARSPAHYKAVLWNRDKGNKERSLLCLPKNKRGFTHSVTAVQHWSKPGWGPLSLLEYLFLPLFPAGSPIEHIWSLNQGNSGKLKTKISPAEKRIP